jgi:hypothetical protein
LQPQVASIIAKNNDPDIASKSVLAAVKAEMTRAAEKLLS